VPEGKRDSWEEGHRNRVELRPVDETRTVQRGWVGGGVRVVSDQGCGGVKGRGSQLLAQDWARAVPHSGPLKAATSTGIHPGGCVGGLWALPTK